MDTGEALNLAQSVLRDLEKRVTLAKKVESLALDLEKHYSNLSDLVNHGDTFCMAHKCLEVTSPKGTGLCPKHWDWNN